MPPENTGEMPQSLSLCGMVETPMGWPRIVSERGQGKELQTLQGREIVIGLLFASPPKTVSLSSPHPFHQPNWFNPLSSIHTRSTSILHPEIPQVLQWKHKTQWKLLAPTQPSLKVEM